MRWSVKWCGALLGLQLAILLGPAARAFEPGQEVVLRENTPLLFREDLFREGQQGEAFEVLAYDADRDLVFLRYEDEEQGTVALNVSSALVALRGERSPETALRPLEIPLPEGDDSRIEDFVFLIETDVSSGSAFAVRMGEQTYLITNAHVIDHAQRIRVVTTGGDRIPVESAIEVAYDRDLLRLPIADSSGLAFQPEVAVGESVYAYGNSEGSAVVVRLEGEILGVGPDRLEVSSGVVPGNSGGPVVDSDGGVVGVVTYLMLQQGEEDAPEPEEAARNLDWIFDGTRFGRTRRFALRLRDDIRWQTCSLEVYRNERLFLAEMDERIEELLETVLSVLAAPYRIRIAERYQSPVHFGFLPDNYNRDVDEFERSIERQIRPGQLRQINARFQQRMRDHGRELQDAIRRVRYHYREDADRLTVRLLHRKAAEKLAMLENLEEEAGRTAERWSRRDFFQFRPR